MATDGAGKQKHHPLLALRETNSVPEERFLKKTSPAISSSQNTHWFPFLESRLTEIEVASVEGTWCDRNYQVQGGET